MHPQGKEVYEERAPGLEFMVVKPHPVAMIQSPRQSPSGVYLLVKAQSNQLIMRFRHAGRKSRYFPNTPDTCTLLWTLVITFIQVKIMSCLSCLGKNGLGYKALYLLREIKYLPP